MALHPIQFLRESHEQARNLRDNPPTSQYPNGSTVYNNDTGKAGIVMAQHMDREHVNVQWKPGIVDVHHVRELHG